MALWGNLDFVWNSFLAEGQSGGILSICDATKGILCFCFNCKGFVGVCQDKGWDKIRCIVTNVYSPFCLIDKRNFWNDILMSKLGFGEALWCVLGDFNSIRRRDERRGVVGSFVSSNWLDFNQFIFDLELVDLSLVGRRFTWFNADESMRSRLDSVLVSEIWLHQWGDAVVHVLPRDLFDHCPLVEKHK